MRNRNVSIYLAGPIDGVPEDDAREWRQAVGQMAPVGVLCFSPAHAYFGASAATARELHYLNHRALEGCDAVLAYLRGPGRAFGTIREIEAARQMHKPTAVVGLKPDESLMTYDLMVCDNLDGAVTAILEAVAAMRKRDGMPIAFLQGMMRPPDQEDDAA